MDPNALKNAALDHYGRYAALAQRAAAAERDKPARPVLPNRTTRPAGTTAAGTPSPLLSYRPPAAAKARPLPLLIMTAVTFLQEAAVPVAEQALMQIEGLKMRPNDPQLPMLVEQLQANPSVVYDSIAKTYTFSSPFSLHDRDGLIALLNRTPEGVLLRDVQDAYKGIEADVEALTAEKRVLVVPNTFERTKVLYLDGPQYYVPLDPEFRAMWQQVDVPDEVDTAKLLRSANIAEMATHKVVNPAAEAEARKKKNKRKRGNVRMSNVHLADVLQQGSDDDDGSEEG